MDFFDILSKVPLWGWILFVVFFVWFMWITRSGRDVDSKNVYSRLQRGWRRIVFWAGDVCFLPFFPFIQIGEKAYEVKVEEWMDILPKLLPGDVVLTRHKGYFFSNSAIPGLFKHALIVANPSKIINEISDIRGMTIIEAISEGVVERHPLYVLSDYMLVLRPKGVTEQERHQAIKLARKIVGCEYDADFNFNIEEELKYLATRSRAYYDIGKLDEARRELDILRINVKAEFESGFSCTETVAAAWWHKRDALRIYRQETCGRKVIIADQFINNGFEIIWMSKNLNNNLLKKLNEESICMINKYKETNK